MNVTSAGHNVSTGSIILDTLMNKTCVGSCADVTTTPVYDYVGAMKFSVAVVLVYGIGVIGVLGIYVRRRPNEITERETNIFVKNLPEYRARFQKKIQLSAVHNLIESIHGKRRASLLHSQTASGSLVMPNAFPIALALKRYNSESQCLRPSPDYQQAVPLLDKRLDLVKSTYSVERQESIPEAEEEVDNNESTVNSFFFTSESEDNSYTISADINLNTALYETEEYKGDNYFTNDTKDNTQTSNTQDGYGTVDHSSSKAGVNIPSNAASGARLATYTNDSCLCTSVPGTDVPEGSEHVCKGRFTVVAIQDE